MSKIRLYLIVQMIFIGSLSGCSFLKIKVEDVSAVTSDPGLKYYSVSSDHIEIDLKGTLRINFESNVDIIKYSEDHDLHLWARIYVCNDMQLDAYGISYIYQNFEKNNMNNDKYYFSLFDGFLRDSPTKKIDRNKYRKFFAINPRPELCLVVGMGTVFWSPYTLITSPIVINRQMTDPALKQLFQWRQQKAGGTSRGQPT